MGFRVNASIGMSGRNTTSVFRIAEQKTKHISFNNAEAFWEIDFFTLP
jgi:hypothetical protein